MDQNVTDNPPLTTQSHGPPDNPLAIEEILRLILQFADQESLVAAASVCQLWSRIALDERWKSLPSVFPLLELVAPRSWLLDPTKYRQNLLSSLAKADWARFREYSSRIQGVGVGQKMRTDLPPESAGLVQMFHGPSPLLPNIKTVSWRYSQSQNYMSIIPFVGPRLETLILKMDEGIDNVAQSLLMQSLTNRMPTLNALQLTSFGPAHHISHPFATLISSSPNLTQILIPPFFLTKEIVAATAQLPRLKTLGWSEWWTNTRNYHESGMSFEFLPESFPQLSTLRFGSLPNRMAEILQSMDHVGRLSAVALDCPAYTSPQEIENVFATLGSCARQLERVLMVCSPVPQLRGSSSNDSLSVDNIRPLFSCTQLKRLTLYAPHLVPPKDEDVVEMGKNWPTMCKLVLCPSPVVKRDSGVDFNILSSFAKSLPNLQDLRLFFGQEVPEFDGDLYPAHRFTKLETLGFGLSRIPKGKTRDIGFLLASVCQHPPVIQSGEGVGYRGDRISSREHEDLMARCTDIRSDMNLAFRIKSSFARKSDGGGPGVAVESG